MGYKYQNRLDEENERAYWSHQPRWMKTLVRVLGWIFTSLFILLALGGSYWWLVASFF